MEKFTRHVQLSSLLDNLERNSNKRKNKSRSNNTEDGELKTRLRELEKENKQLKASEKSRAEKMKRVEAIYVATLRKKEDLEKDSVQLELVKCKLEGAEQEVAELTRRNKELEKKNKKLIERRCQYCPKDNEILSSNVSVKSLASQTGLTEHVVGILREEKQPGKNKHKAAMLKSIAEEKAMQEEQDAGDGDNKIMDEMLQSALHGVQLEMDDNIDEDDDGGSNDEDVNDKSNIINNFTANFAKYGLIRQNPMPVVPMTNMKGEADNSMNVPVPEKDNDDTNIDRNGKVDNFDV